VSPDLASGFVAPAYGHHSLADLVPAVASALGVPGFASVPGLRLPDGSSYVVFLIDGLGSELLRRYSHAAPFLSSLIELPATAGVPSTTATSLASLGTGLLPGQHGLVGYTARIPGTDRLLNHLQWDKSIDPVAWQPHETVFGRLAATGVRVTAINKREFSSSGLTIAAHRGASYVGADKVGERIAAVLDASGRAPSFTYVYDSDLDWTGHKYGVASTAWLQQLAMIDAAAEHLREELPSATRLVVVADHGMIDSPPESRIDIAAQPDLRAGLALVGGEARFRHLYCRPGAVDDVAAAWRSILGDRAEVLTRDELGVAGWLGPLDALVTDRVGDVVVACRDDHAVMSSADFPHEDTLVGLHGSLTPDEMLIPILVA
jgi:hypothetical protein